MKFALRGGIPIAPLAAAAFAGVGVALSAAPSSAQVPFQAVRPRNGATVRETVKIMYPRAALRDVAYFTVFLDDKFLTSVDVPPPGDGWQTGQVQPARCR